MDVMPDYFISDDALLSVLPNNLRQTSYTYEATKARLRTCQLYDGLTLLRWTSRSPPLKQGPLPCWIRHVQISNENLEPSCHCLSIKDQ
jgi:hypothetical protein